MTPVLRIILALTLMSCAFGASAHKPSDSYLTLRTHTGDAVVAGQWDIALRDLELPLHLDANNDGAITWGELRQCEPDVFKYALQRLTLKSEGESCTLAPTQLLVDDHTDGGYAVLQFTAQCATSPKQIEVGYHLLFDIDPSHRGLLRLEVDGNSRSAVMSPAQSTQMFDLANNSRWSTFIEFVNDGMHHIWIGYDHMLFLISLLLPAVLVRRENHWIPVDTLRNALLSVLAVVTAFTLSHSITLTLAALGIVGLPSRLVESGIALSVMLAALNNIWPVVTRKVWVIAFGFGLVHGFGFASVLADLGLPRDALALSLAGFNIGVEIGQLTVVLLFVPVIFLIRKKSFYRPVFLVGGSSIIALVASVWLLSRIFGFGLG
jgi:hypothetical protein